MNSFVLFSFENHKRFEFFNGIHEIGSEWLKVCNKISIKIVAKLYYSDFVLFFFSSYLQCADENNEISKKHVILRVVNTGMVVKPVIFSLFPSNNP